MWYMKVFDGWPPSKVVTEGSFESLSAATDRIAEIELYPASVPSIRFQIVIRNEIKIGNEEDTFEVLQHFGEHTNHLYIVKRIRQ
jgi:hypothetical protein